MWSFNAIGVALESVTLCQLEAVVGLMLVLCSIRQLFNFSYHFFDDLLQRSAGPLHSVSASLERLDALQGCQVLRKQT